MGLPQVRAPGGGRPGRRRRRHSCPWACTSGRRHMHSRPTWISHQALTLATVSLSLSHAHTYTHTHTLSLTLSLSLCAGQMQRRMRTECCGRRTRTTATATATQRPGRPRCVSCLTRRHCCCFCIRVSLGRWRLTGRGAPPWTGFRAFWPFSAGGAPAHPPPPPPLRARPALCPRGSSFAGRRRSVQGVAIRKERMLADPGARALASLVADCPAGQARSSARRPLGHQGAHLHRQTERERDRHRGRIVRRHTNRQTRQGVIRWDRGVDTRTLGAFGGSAGHRVP
jgi:hypothetical protein